MSQRLLGTMAVVSVLLVASLWSAQSSPPEVLAQLRSEDWHNRAIAYEHLRNDGTLLVRRDVRAALLDLLDREDRLIESTLRESKEKVGVSAKYGEEFSEYVGQLGDTVDSFVDWSDPAQVCIMARGSYNPTSQFANTLAAHAKLAVPCLMEVYGSDVGLTRAKAVPVMILALARPGADLSIETVQAVKRVVLAALKDPSEAVRIGTVRALGDFGEADMIPALQKVATTDPAPAAGGRSIRTLASEAIAKIQQRTAKR